MRKHMRLLILAVVVVASPLLAQPWEPLPADPYFSTYKPVQAPPCKDLVLKGGNKLAICGDSITEQKMYSRIIETYLTVCMPAWVERAKGTVEDLNHSLAEFRNVGVTLAADEQVGFADVFCPMLVGGFEARRRHRRDIASSRPSRGEWRSRAAGIRSVPPVRPTTMAPSAQA